MADCNCTRDFLDLISVATGRRDALSAPLSREEWERMYSIAKGHAVLGTVFPALDALPKDQRAPLGIYSKWALAVEKVQSNYRRCESRAVELTAMFAADGFPSCILKGLSASALYPDPSLRQQGDIDIWVPAERERLVEYLCSRCRIAKTVYHHCDAHFFKDTSVEVHFVPTWMNNPFRNARLSRYLSAYAPGPDGSRTSAYNSPAAGFDAVYQQVHIFRHLLEEGVGLRQIWDYSHVLSSLDADTSSKAYGVIRSIGLGGFCSALMWVEGEVFGLSEDKMLCPPDARNGRRFLDEIMRSGNFGSMDERNTHAGDESIAGHTWRKLKRQMRYFRFFPGEVFWTPGFMLWQYLWRMRHGYLYKGR